MSERPDDDTMPPADARGGALEGAPALAGGAPDNGAGGAPTTPRELRITVARSGGVGGLAPRWSVEASEASDVDSWWSLVESCPWDAPDEGDEPAASGADRFVYTIRVLVDSPADTPPLERDARLPEQHLTPPWRTLIDRVKHSSRP
ncbi:protealysin inhibitor emfourin [Herbiconiux sp. P18]|uniref:protealysin inhibitor emfourin n=1 Tax=Herbiconiux liangxiaofengii TaxID=3342795 RepID=UPI0035B8C95D